MKNSIAIYATLRIISLYCHKGKKNVLFYTKNMNNCKSFCVVLYAEREYNIILLWFTMAIYKIKNGGF